MSCTNLTSCQSCNDGYYQEEDKCLPCDSSCKSCYSDTESSCLSCDSSRLLDQKTGKCITECDSGFYKDICYDNSYCCREICGDGKLIILHCDDGNLDEGDGCSSTCQIEPNFICGFFNGKDKNETCKYISPLKADLTLPEYSATLARITFNQPLKYWNETLYQYISISLSGINNKTYSYNLTFKDNQTIDIEFNYSQSFKTSSLLVEFTNLSSFLSIFNQSLSTSSLKTVLSNFMLLSINQQKAVNTTQSSSSATQASGIIIVAFMNLLNIGPFLGSTLLANIQLMFYLSLIQINYPVNFQGIIDGSKVLSFNFFSNYFAIFSKKFQYIKEKDTIFDKNDINSAFLISNGSIIQYLLLLLIFQILILIWDKLSNKKFFFRINTQTYIRVLLSNIPFNILTCLLSIFNFNNDNWFQSISSIISFLFLSTLIMLAKKAQYLIQIQIYLHNRNLIQSNGTTIIMDNYKPFKSQLFGIIDLIKWISFSLSLIVFESYVITNTIILFCINLIYLLLLIIFKPSVHNKSLIFTEIGNLAVLSLCILWALDEKYDWWTEDNRYNMGWIGIGLLSLIFLINLISGLILAIMANKGKINFYYRKFCKLIQIKVSGKPRS